MTDEKVSLPILETAEGAPQSACTAVRVGLTDREMAILREMSETKRRLRIAPEAERPALAARLEALKGARQEARRERMALLGHSTRP